MLRGEGVDRINSSERASLLGQRSMMRLGDYDGNTVLEPDDIITEEALQQVDKLGILGEFYSDRLLVGVREELGTIWVRPQPSLETEYEEEEVEERLSIY